MDTELINIINYIQSFKLDTYRKYQPELIDGKNIIMNRDNQPKENIQTTPSKDYVKLINQHHKIIYRNDYEARETATKIKLTLKQPNNPDLPENYLDILKPWPKISNSSKVKLLMTFIDSLTPSLNDDQKRQLRYLLVSANSQKHTLKQVDYDSINGHIIKINNLSYDNNEFKFDNVQQYFPFKVQQIKPIPERKKIILKLSSKN